MRAVAVAAVVLLYVLHQDFWFWREARPLVFGFLPIGLFYHAAFTVASAGVLWLLVKFAWPSHLEEASQAARGIPASERREPGRRGPRN
jgi:Protein of unknown function (DUF3311)